MNRSMSAFFLSVLFLLSTNAIAEDSEFITTQTPENVYRTILGGVADYSVFQDPTVEIDNILSSMFWVFNISVLGVLSWLMFVILMEKVLVSGNDGKVKSDKYNDTMTVVRSSLSLCGLMPVISGFCLAQVLVAFMGMQASFIADEVNAAANKYTYVNNSVSGYKPDPFKINNSVNAMLDSAVCATAMNSYYSEHPDFESKYRINLKDVSDSTRPDSESSYFKYAYQNSQGKPLCGAVSMLVNSDATLGINGDPTGIISVMTENEKQVRERIVSAHKSAVKKTHDFIISSLTAGVVVPGENVDKEALTSAFKEAKTFYHKSVQSAFKEAGAAWAAKWDQEMSSNNQSQTTSYAAKRGWIYNGFTWIEKGKAEAFMSKLSTQGPTPESILYEELDQEFITERLDRAKNITGKSKFGDDAKKTQSDIEQLDMDYLIEQFSKGSDYESVTSQFFGSIVNSALVETQFNFEHYDPITNLQHLGYRLVNAGWIMIGGGVLLDIKSQILFSEGARDSLLRKGINFVTGGLFEGGVSALAKALEYVVASLLTLGPILVAVGSVLAYWLPALPFFMWDLAVLGNYLLVLIAFMAAPLWMAAHAMPGGDGFSSDHSKQGWLTMITILARPSIMVITWHVALLLMKEMGKFTSLFLDYAPMANADAFVGLWGALVMWFIYIIFELVIVYRCTSLIYEVPDQMPIYYGSTNTTANENIGEGKGQSMVAGWQSSTERSVGSAPQANGGSNGKGMDGNLI